MKVWLRNSSWSKAFWLKTLGVNNTNNRRSGSSRKRRKALHTECGFISYGQALLGRDCNDQYHLIEIVDSSKFLFACLKYSFETLTYIETT